MGREWLKRNKGFWELKDIKKMTSQEKNLYPVDKEGLVFMRVLEGECQVRAGNRWIDLGGSHILLMDQCLESTLASASLDLLLEVVIFTLSKKNTIIENLWELKEKFPEFEQYCQEKPGPLLFNDTFALIAPLADNLQMFSYDFTAFKEMLIHLYINYALMVVMSGKKEKTMELMGKNPYVDGALLYIEKHYMGSLSVEKIAQGVGVHPGYLHKLFLEHTGKRVNEYITEKRIEYIQFLLIHTDFSMEKIASLTGIASVQYLSKIFKKQTGISPKNFRTERSITCEYQEVEIKRETESR